MDKPEGDGPGYSFDAGAVPLRFSETETVPRATFSYSDLFAKVNNLHSVFPGCRVVSGNARRTADGKGWRVTHVYEFEPDRGPTTTAA